VEVERTAGGKLFHARGPATENAVYTSYNTIYKLLILTVSNKRVNTNALLATVGFRVKLWDVLSERVHSTKPHCTVHSQQHCIDLTQLLVTDLVNTNHYDIGGADHMLYAAQTWAGNYLHPHWGCYTPLLTLTYTPQTVLPHWVCVYCSSGVFVHSVGF